MKYLYVILAGKSSVKIGIATNPESRCSELQTGNAEKLHILTTIGPHGCVPHLERFAHQVLAPHRLKGEWFKWNETVMGFVDILRCVDIDESVFEGTMPT